MIYLIIQAGTSLFFCFERLTVDCYSKITNLLSPISIDSDLCNYNTDMGIPSSIFSIAFLMDHIDRTVSHYFNQLLRALVGKRLSGLSSMRHEHLAVIFYGHYQSYN